jgi:dipeptidyl-peptidase-2
MPFGNNSLIPPYVGLQNVEQVLADFAVILPDLKKQYGAPNAISFAVGGSYGGMLTAWFRMKYPHIIDGGLAASAPIISFTGAPDIPTFFETTTNDYAKANAKCPEIARNAFQQLESIAQKPGGLEYISNKMSLCKVITMDQYEHLVLWAVNAFGNLAMLNYPYPTDFGIQLPGHPVDLSCQLLVNYSSDPLVALAKAAGVYYNGTAGNLPCYDIFDEFVFCADQTGCGTGPLAEAWDYQACTELIFFENTNGVTDMFPARTWTFQNLTDYCQKTWSITPRSSWRSTEYGANEYKSASRIIFSNGLLDPWHGGGVLTNFSDSLPSLIVTEGAHHLDLRSSNPNDPPSVIQVRASEAGYFRKWMSEIREEKYGLRENIELTKDATFPWAKILLSNINYNDK